jgi:ribonuclease HI
MWMLHYLRILALTVAVIARDEAGTFLGASAFVMEGVLDPETAEALACREGLALASDLMLHKVRIATDCANIVKNMHSLAMSPCGHIIRDIKAGMASFASMEVVSINSNGGAHRLAKSSIYESVGWYIWLLFPPNEISTDYSDI